MRFYPYWEKIGITQNRYYELLYFCRQYPEWKSQADHNGINSEDTIARIKLVDKCAISAGKGKWSEALIRIVCMAMPYSSLDDGSMSAADRNSFFDARREFFILLNLMKQ